MKPKDDTGISMECCGYTVSPELSHEGGIVFVEWKCSCGVEMRQTVGEVNPDKATLFDRYRKVSGPPFLVSDI